MIDLTDYYVTQIKTNHGEYLLGHRGRITDEGSFYRIDGTLIIDKCRIKSIELDGEKLTIQLSNEDYILMVEQRKLT